jgi:hypothetical protein
MIRYYYTDPIKAIYMMKEFGVKFYADTETGLINFADFEVDEGAISIQEFLEITKLYPKKILVAKESEHIFEPKEGDMDQYGRFFIKVKTTTETFIDLSVSDTKIKYDMRWSSIFEKADQDGQRISESLKTNPKIIMRDNKHFFTPENETI